MKYLGLKKRPGGQHVGAYPQGVKVLHKPTGIMFFVKGKRTQHHNKETCLLALELILSDL